MSKAMQLVGIILLGIFTLVIIFFISDVQNGNELDYYLLQEVTEASMYDAVDLSYYRATGLLKVDRDMFLESFNRRFAASVSADRNYTIKIIDFNETPPKVSVEVSAPTVASVKGETALVVNRVSGIIETIYDDYVESVPLEGGAGWKAMCSIDPSGKLSFKVDSQNEFSSYSILQDGKEIQNNKITTGTFTTDINSNIKDYNQHTYEIIATDVSGTKYSCSVKYQKKQVVVDHTCDNPTDFGDPKERGELENIRWENGRCVATQNQLRVYLGSDNKTECYTKWERIDSVPLNPSYCEQQENDDDDNGPYYCTDDQSECLSLENSGASEGDIQACWNDFYKNCQSWSNE